MVQHCSWKCLLVQCWKGYRFVLGYLREFGLKVITKPLISRKERVEENCSKIHFIDESKFNLFRSDGKHYIHCYTEERLNPKCIKSVKGGSVIVWGMFSAAGVGSLIQIQGRVNTNTYQNLLQNMQFLPCKHLPTSLRFSCKTILPSRCKTVPWS